MTQLTGWGGYPVIDATVLAPAASAVASRALPPQSIPRGLGRSYGDSALADVVLDTTAWDRFIACDVDTGVLTVEAGVSLREILRRCVPLGWFLPVTPGTSYVTVGGAIAGDVHGKNHHVAGTFGVHVHAMTMLLGTGDVVTASRTEHPDLFRATCGGMGLTGVILTATVQLLPIHSAWIIQRTTKSAGLEEALSQFTAHGDTPYSVAWIDCVARGRALGRSVLMTGDHATEGGLSFSLREPPTVPVHTPAVLLNSRTMRAFNAWYYVAARHATTRTVSLRSFFFPLDAVGGWNKLYGRPGFLQWQCVIPTQDGVAGMRTILTRIADSGAGSFLAVLKQFGPANDHVLSFPMAGYTLALDFRRTADTIPLLHTLDAMVAELGGRLYLAKDAAMTAAIFRRMYPQWEAFEGIRERYGAIGRFASAQSQRLGLA